MELKLTRPTDNLLRPLWERILEIYEVYRGICERHNLRFYALAGTMLGAVRHGGFIPWDDDLDVMMPIEDYDQFLRFAYDELPPHLKMVTSWNTPEYGYQFGKVQDIRGEISEEVKRLSGHPQSQGVFIDVFPYSGICDETLSRKIISFYMRLRQCGCKSCARRTLQSKIAAVVGRTVCAMLPGPSSYDALECVKHRLARVKLFDEAERVNVFNGEKFAYWERGSKWGDVGYPRKWFEEVRWIPFENTKIPAPSCVHEWLTAYFGDYMELPPKDQRVFKHRDEPIAAWKFGPTTRRKPYIE